MKLIRFGDPENERPGLLLGDGRRVACPASIADWAPSFFASTQWNSQRHHLPMQAESWLEVDPRARWASPIARPGKIICVGLNYKEHAREAGMQLPIEPILFMKAPNTVVGPYDNLIIPRGSQKTDWEIELGVVIGSSARYLEDPQQGLNHILGYCITHDVSERHFQLERGGQWDKGKSCDTFNPLGPFLVTPDELGSPANLGLTLKLNGETMQQGSTATMLFDVPFLIYYISQFMTLEPGDLIATGTPPGVGLGRNPTRYLRPGDTVELTIDGLGIQRQRCIACEALARG